MNKIKVDESWAYEHLITLGEVFHQHQQLAPYGSDDVDKFIHRVLGRCFEQFLASARASLLVRCADDSLFVTMPTLCRPAYEFAARLYWAWDNPERWRRVTVGWAKDSHKWAKKMEASPIFQGHGAKQRAFIEMVLQKIDPDGTTKSLPTFEDLLSEIESDEKSRRDTKMLFVTASSSYAMIWKGMCSTAHGHLSATEFEPNFHAVLAITGMRVTLVALLNALALRLSESDEELRRKRCLADRLLVLIADDQDFDFDRIRLTIRPVGSTRRCEWALTS